MVSTKKYKSPRIRNKLIVVEMNRICFFIAAFLAAVALCNGETLRPLKGMQRLSIFCENLEQQSFVKTYVDNPNFDILRLTRILEEPIDILVTADEVQFFKNALESKNIQYRVEEVDVEQAVHEEAMLNGFAKLRTSYGKLSERATPFSYYPRYNEIESYLESLTAEYSKIVTVESIGNSWEGRPIYVVKISSGGENKPAILIDAGIHAREWIAPSTALHAIHELVTVKNNSLLYKNVDWYIIPSLNPDGYEFSHTDYRFWRKTRSNPKNTCPGVDGNRNFDYKWMTVGASSRPCAETYAGKKAFSEKETQALRDFVLANSDSIKVYLTLHSYGNYFLHPWGWTSDLPDNEPTLRVIAEEAEKKLSSKYGTRYTIGSSTNVLYAAAGGSDDWVMKIGGAELSYTIELPGGRFDPPASQITKVGIETFEAFKVFQKYVEKKYASFQ